ncbi:MAG: FmdB family zinc ribbon protein [Nitrospinota bacterium]
MPIYEYQCERCGQIFEVLQKFTHATARKCDACGGKARRLISQTSFVLRGDGWHVTDYPSASRKKAISAEKEGGKGSGEGGGEKKKEVSSPKGASAGD